MWILRKVLNPMEDIEITELILDRMKKSKTNEAFLASMNAGTAGMEQNKEMKERIVIQFSKRPEESLLGKM